MSWVPIVIAVWVTLAGSAGLLAVALGRAAYLGDEQQREQQRAAQRAAETPAFVERRSGTGDRRAQSRPWTAEAPGRRAEDVLRRDLADARRTVAEAEAKLVEAEQRRSA